jgi:hypothetical protein
VASSMLRPFLAQKSAHEVELMKRLQFRYSVLVLFVLLFAVQSPILANSVPLTVSVGYADNTHCASALTPPLFQGSCISPLPALFPNPWNGSPNTTFLGTGINNVGFDAGALLLTNTSGAAVTVTDVTVTIGATTFDLWGSFAVPNGTSTILTQNGDPTSLVSNFDTSDVAGFNGGVSNGVIPSIAITIGGTTNTLFDTNEILNTGGFDLGCTTSDCVLTNESHPWSLIPGQVTGTPEPSSLMLLGVGLLGLVRMSRRKLGS